MRSNLRRLFAAAVAPALLIAGMQAPTPPLAATQQVISQTFNNSALAGKLALSCDEQRDVRRGNIETPYFKQTPDYFRAKDTEFFMASRHMTDAQKKQVRELFDIVPQHIKALAYVDGVVYVLPRFALVEAMPELGKEAGYYKDSGLYFALEKRAYVPLEKGVVSIDANGNVSASRYIPSTRDQLHIIQHESGHMMDDILGDYSLNSVGKDGDSRLTNRKDYMDALDRDLDNLVKRSSSSIARYGYYMPSSHDGHSLPGVHKELQRAKREIFAQLWAEANGSNRFNISHLYPNAYKVVKEINDYMKDMHRKHGSSCNYTMDGQAKPSLP